MADDLTNRGPRDRNRVDVNEDWELRYWTKKFGCTATELRDSRTRRPRGGLAQAAGGSVPGQILDHLPDGRLDGGLPVGTEAASEVVPLVSEGQAA